MNGRKSPWYERSQRREKRLRLINKTVLPFLKANRVLSRLYGAVKQMPVETLVHRETSSDYCIDMINVYLEPKPHVLIRYVTTRQKFTPRDFYIAMRRIRSFLERYAPPGADITIAIVGDGTKFTSGVWELAREYKVIIDGSEGDVFIRKIARFYEKRLYNLLKAMRRAQIVRGGAALLAASLNIILRHLLGMGVELWEVYTLAQRIVDGMTPDEAWKVLAPPIPPPSPP